MGWPPRYESPLSEASEIKEIKGTPEYTRRLAVPNKAAPKDVSFAYFQDPLLKKFSKMVAVHSDGQRGENIMLKVYELIKSKQLQKGKNAVTDPSTIILQAIENTRPIMLLERVKVGGVIYMVPAPITETR